MGDFQIQIRFVCNQNLARSQILSAYFGSVFPEFDVNSYGLIAKEFSNLPRIVLELFELWGLPSYGKGAKNLYAHMSETNEETLFVCVSTFISDEIRSTGFKGQIIDLEINSREFGLELRDPQLMNRSECGVELAKYIFVAFRSFARVGLLPPSPVIKAFIPSSNSKIKDTIIHALNTFPQAVCVFGDVVAPIQNKEAFAEFSPSIFEVESRSSLIPSQTFTTGASLLFPSNMALSPARVYLSDSWSNFFIQDPRVPIVLVTPPLRVNMGGCAESFLAALPAAEIEVVS